MPNLVNKALMAEIQREFQKMGSCLVVSFDKLNVSDAEALRKKFREQGFRYRVVKNRLAIKAFQELRIDMSAAFTGKCGVVLAPEERAIEAAKLVREAMAKVKQPPVVVTGGVIEGQPILGPAAATIHSMPDRNTVRAQLVGAIVAPMRSLASCVNNLGGGVARALQAHVDKQPAT
ncbi:MAG: 50S ribosomal protein L10 [Planctomycetes bacterium]|nr:50S ribosomal protein L10 [Planctomycetota bacterium]